MFQLATTQAAKIRIVPATCGPARRRFSSAQPKTYLRANVPLASGNKLCSLSIESWDVKIYIGFKKESHFPR